MQFNVVCDHLPNGVLNFALRKNHFQQVFRCCCCCWDDIICYRHYSALGNVTFKCESISMFQTRIESLMNAIHSKTDCFNGASLIERSRFIIKSMHILHLRLSYENDLQKSQPCLFEIWFLSSNTSLLSIHVAMTMCVCVLIVVCGALFSRGETDASEWVSNHAPVRVCNVYILHVYEHMHAHKHWYRIKWLKCLPDTTEPLIRVFNYVFQHFLKLHANKHSTATRQQTILCIPLEFFKCRSTGQRETFNFCSVFLSLFLSHSLAFWIVSHGRQCCTAYQHLNVLCMSEFTLHNRRTTTMWIFVGLYVDRCVRNKFRSFVNSSYCRTQTSSCFTVMNSRQHIFLLVSNIIRYNDRYSHVCMKCAHCNWNKKNRLPHFIFHYRTLQCPHTKKRFADCAQIVLLQNNGNFLRIRSIILIFSPLFSQFPSPPVIGGCSIKGWGKN